MVLGRSSVVGCQQLVKFHQSGCQRRDAVGGGAVLSFRLVPLRGRHALGGRGGLHFNRGRSANNTQTGFCGSSRVRLGGLLLHGLNGGKFLRAGERGAVHHLI